MRAVDLAEKLAYYRALSRSAPVGSLLRSSARKLVRAAARASRPGLRLPRPVEVERAARALSAAPSPFDDADGARRQVFERELHGAVAAVVAAARRAAAGEVEVFGRPANAFELYRDPLSGREAGELA